MVPCDEVNESTVHEDKFKVGLAIVKFYIHLSSCHSALTPKEYKSIRVKFAEQLFKKVPLSDFNVIIKNDVCYVSILLESVNDVLGDTSFNYHLYLGKKAVSNSAIQTEEGQGMELENIVKKSNNARNCIPAFTTNINNDHQMSHCSVSTINKSSFIKGKDVESCVKCPNELQSVDAENLPTANSESEFSSLSVNTKDKYQLPLLSVEPQIRKNTKNELLLMMEVNMDDIQLYENSNDDDRDSP